MNETTRPRTNRRLVAVLGGGALAVLLGFTTGCTTATPPAATSTSAPASRVATTPSAPAPSAAEILEKARKNAVDATSAAFTGRIDQNGTEMVIDFKGTSDGSSSDVTLVAESQGTVRVISAGGEVYLQGDAQFWNSQGLSSPVAAGKFVQAPAGAKELSEQLSLNQFLDEAFTAVTSSQLSDTVSSETVGGVDSWVVTDARGKAEGALYVSKSDFEIVRFTGSSTSPGQLDFSSWNEDLAIDPPPADQVAALG